MTRYSPSRSYITASALAGVTGGASVWLAIAWRPALLVAGLFLASALILLFMALRPTIEIHGGELVVGRRRIPWSEVRRVDRTGWVSPLVVRLTLVGDRRLLVIFPGDLKASNHLLRQLRESAVDALIDGIPFQQFWGIDDPIENAVEKSSRPSYPVLCEDDENEIERLYRRLKTVGHFDANNTRDEN